ncbi:hypothetical protein An03g00270 [Aspergillus niger]|uniref:Uncharacterized protein n=2 Tax=Aspergillus niger TaxID=5061 RepID=A2QFP5_ASPNC|nr:hypothetical protein An03g00270 [Aspergillus niger]CAK38005.1 hypothetical protein An03g00270 [Aspergillus niger]
MVSEKRSHCQDPEPSDGGFVAEALFSGNGVGQLMPVRRGLRQELEVRGEKILAAAVESILASQGLGVGKHEAAFNVQIPGSSIEEVRVTCHIIGVQKGELSPKDCSFHWLRRFPLHAIGERWVQARQEIWVVDGSWTGKVTSAKGTQINIKTWTSAAGLMTRVYYFHRVST